jgi:hypothetical protein
MCCFFLVLLFLGPRVGLLIFWLFPYGQLMMHYAFQNWFWPIVGLVFLPWTTLMYVLVCGPNGMVGFDWVWVGLGVVADIASYSGGAWKRKEVPGY